MIKTKFPRQHLKDQHDSLLVEIELMLRSQGVDVVRCGAEAGGHLYAPDLFVRPSSGNGFYLDLKLPVGPRIGLALDEWLYFRLLGDVFLLAVRAEGSGYKASIVSVDQDKPLFLGASREDFIPVMAYSELKSMDVAIRFFQRGDPGSTSNKPFVVYRPRLVFPSSESAIDFILRQAGATNK